jgi:magnesium-transporting ATPase (P-type)
MLDLRNRFLPILATAVVFVPGIVWTFDRSKSTAFIPIVSSAVLIWFIFIAFKEERTRRRHVESGRTVNVIRSGNEVPTLETVLKTGDLIALRRGSVVPCRCTVVEVTEAIRISFEGSTDDTVPVQSGDTIDESSVILTGRGMAQLIESPVVGHPRNPMAELLRSSWDFVWLSMGSLLCLSLLGLRLAISGKEDLALVAGASIPDGLTLVFGFTIFRIVRRLKKEHSISVQRVSAINAIARMEAIVSDKTGTLTDQTVLIVGTPTANLVLRELARRDDSDVAKLILRQLEGLSGEISGEVTAVNAFYSEQGYSTIDIDGQTWKLSAEKDGNLVFSDPSGNGAVVVERQEILRIGWGSLVEWAGVHRITVDVLSGDHVSRMSIVEIDPLVTVRGNLRPVDKLAAVVHLQKNRHRVVGALGNGVNDLRMLGAADAYICLSDASGVVVRNADLVVPLGSKGTIELLKPAVDIPRAEYRVLDLLCSVLLAKAIACGLIAVVAGVASHVGSSFDFPVRSASLFLLGPSVSILPPVLSRFLPIGATTTGLKDNTILGCLTGFLIGLAASVLFVAFDASSTIVATLLWLGCFSLCAIGIRRIAVLCLCTFAFAVWVRSELTASGIIVAAVFLAVIVLVANLMGSENSPSRQE